MRLIRCHIENFGNLHDMTVEFEPDFHLISEPNGWGKSTLAAFLRVMFFGFEGENKRKEPENERKRFEPWQGGAYGGEITFETGGQIYTAARIFSGKKANDTFELRDARTNLKSDDYTGDLGEELFLINGESFARTVFLGQNDCATAATDSINAKIGSLTDNMNDLDCFEKAAAALTEVQYSLTPRRKTGLLSRMNDEITRMQTEVAQNASLEDSIREYERLEQEARQRLEENHRQQDSIDQLSEQVSRIRDRDAKRKEYLQLCDACTEAEKTFRAAQARFPGEVPSEEELNSCMTACGDMERAEEGMRIYALTPEQEEQLRDLAASDVSAEAEPGEPDGSGTDAEAGPQQREVPKRWLILLICGIVLGGAALAVFFGISRSWPWIIAAAAGLALLVAGLVVRRADKKRTAEENAEQERIRDDQARLRQAQRELARERAARIEALTAQQRDYQTSREQYEEKRSFVQSQIRKMGLTPEEALNTQLQGIWRERIDWQNAKQEAGAALQKKEEFEAGSDMSFLLEEDARSVDKLPSLEELHSLKRQLEGSADDIRTQADVYEKQLNTLREKHDELAETAAHLAGMQEERTIRKAQFDRVCLAFDCLTAAKESMTAKYMEPLMRSFSEYYEILTGEPAGRYRMDANTNLTVEEQGMQRETFYLSRGWQDLIGLCLRLALVDAMYPDEKPFLILDDPLVNLDPEKRAGGKRLMEAVAQTYQVIYFTCREV